MDSDLKNKINAEEVKWRLADEAAVNIDNGFDARGSHRAARAVRGFRTAASLPGQGRRLRIGRPLQLRVSYLSPSPSSGARLRIITLTRPARAATNAATHYH
jgi:hypothetical protein